MIGRTYRKHRHQEVLRFLREVDKAVPADQEIHIVLDNYATHKHEKVLDWIERKKRIFLHFTPTSASWANLVERFFATLTDKQIRRGVFTSLPHLEKCLREYLKRHSCAAMAGESGIARIGVATAAAFGLGVRRPLPLGVGTACEGVGGVAAGYGLCST